MFFLRRGSTLRAFTLLAAACCTTFASADAPPRFPPGAVWHQDISQAALHPNSSSMINTLAGLGGFGNGRMQIDFSIHVVRADANAPLRSIVGYPSNGDYYFPDCEAVGTQMPVPANSAIEGNTGLTCNNEDEDCHLLVVQGNKLYEAYRANASGSSGLQAQCLAVWKLDAVYPIDNRGDHCTSADAAGFPMAPLLFNADEIFTAMQTPNSDLGHAIRFILPNSRMATSGGKKQYVRPASHAGGPSGPEGTVPYGSRLRLRADFPVNLYSPGAQVILRTMQRYGIVLADGGNVALTAESDLFTMHRWSDVGVSARTFDQEVAGSPVRIQDFQVIDTGARIIETYDCVRNPDPGGGTPTLSIADASTSEGNSGTKTLGFTVSLSQAAATAVTLNVATSNGTATSGSDYSALSQTGVTIPAGSTSATVNVTINGDTTVEPNETFNVALSNVSGATLGDGSATGTITNDDTAPTPSLSIADVSTSEGNSGTKTLTFTVSLSSAASTAVTYNIATSNGTATSGSDYIASSLTGQSIAAGATSKTFVVTINGDTTVEPNETFNVTVSSVSGATVADGSAVGTITNDDTAPTPSLSIADVSTSEGNSGTKTLTFTVALSAAASTAVTYNIATSNGTATAGSDYVASSLTGQSIPAGSTSKTFVVTINGDTTVEPNETFNVTVSSVSGATVSDGSAIGTITNDDTASQPSLSIADVSVAEGQIGTRKMTFTVKLSAAATSAVTYNIATANGTATAGSDYVAASLSGQSIPAGTLNKTFVVTINGDRVQEPDETFTVNVSGVSGATVSDGSAVGTILNDERR
ncbi:Calx-beta domain-containing protein [Arenimonas sp.]|uniref:Calx-beta domain-containing protein n=1 Tax=Arenimonas sp. TaxID=1872635 RepID=UPI0039E4D871